MGYTDIAELAGDADFLARVNAAYAVETLTKLHEVNYLWPESWTHMYAWAMAAQPGFGAAYAYAKQTGVENPGKDPAVITDNQITAGVQSILAAMPPPQPEFPTE
jgi:hypothetical protein